jgi:hypothetical protein
MIRHCVFIRFRSGVSRQEQAELFAQITALRQHLPGMLGVHVGGNVSPEGLDKGYASGFIVDFEDVAARDAYLADPAHAAAGAGLVAAAEGGIEGILVYDLELPN